MFNPQEEANISSGVAVFAIAIVSCPAAADDLLQDHIKLFKTLKLHGRELKIQQEVKEICRVGVKAVNDLRQRLKRTLRHRDLIRLATKMTKDTNDKRQRRMGNIMLWTLSHRRRYRLVNINLGSRAGQIKVIDLCTGKERA